MLLLLLFLLGYYIFNDSLKEYADQQKTLKADNTKANDVSKKPSA